MRLRNARDLLAGCLFLVFGVAFLVLARDYQLGSARRMGPAYFPVVLSLILITIGLATMTRALLVAAPPIRDFAGKSLALVTASVVLFGLIVQGAGLAVATAALVLASAPASRSFRLFPTLLLALALALFCTLVFATGLGLPFPALGPWLRG
jgi:putative tricarboxylic transport membrane protein